MLKVAHQRKLQNRVMMPAAGFGAAQISPDEFAAEVVATAIKTGYRLIDTARTYGNEKGVGDGLRASSVPRDQLFITTKVWNDDQGYGRTLKAFDTSLHKLGLDYLDLYLIHWPATSRRHESWRALERLYEEGRIRAAGVCNYTIEHLRDTLNRASLPPAVNQVEFHPFIYEQQRQLLDFCAEQSIVVEAYSPLRRLSDPAAAPIVAIARELDRTPQQVVLRWCIQHGTVPLARSTKPEHIASNFNIFDFELDDTAMRRLDSLSDGLRVTWDPATMG